MRLTENGQMGESALFGPYLTQRLFGLQIRNVRYSVDRHARDIR